ncbi:MAG: hypothetical protein KFF49_10400 [Bacteroidales bacterium]|nr:hypothetical protein [Bacteroidales bacterium]
MKKSLFIYIFLLMIIFPAAMMAQRGQEDIRREVTLYNPFKPSLNKASKLSFFPEISDTSLIAPEFNYTISAKPFMPEYEIRTISPARLEPDPLPKLYKGYMNLGFGNYFSPLAELSISSERSRNSLAGIYLGHESSFGKLAIDDNLKVYGAYMDNLAKIFVSRFLRRAALDASIDFKHIRRYAYGGDPVMLLTNEIDKDSLKIEYLNPRADISIYSTRLDSSKIYYNVGLNYNLLYQTSAYYQHLAGLYTNLGYDMDIFYAGLDLEYEFVTIPNVEDKARHRVSLDPAITKRSSNWSFRAGLKFTVDARYYYDPLVEYKTRLFLHPDLRFQFSVIPNILGMYVGLDGEHESNNASEIIYTNPFIVFQNTGGLIEPSDDLYTMQPTDTKLRLKGGITGHASLNTSYRLGISYSMFEDMVFYINDSFQGRGLAPVYDNGELLKLQAEFSTRISKELSLSARAAYYSYQMEFIEKPWHKPSWDGKLALKYKLRDKIVASADVNALSERYGRFGPMPYFSSTDYKISEIPVNLSLSLGFEYRYTRILSFWARINNIAVNRYYEWNLYPSQRLLLMAGFTYSL